MEQKWSVRAYRERDDERIFTLWQAVYPEQKYDFESWMRWWYWMYMSNPSGRGRIWLAEDDSKIVGQSAIIPAKMKIGAEVITGFQSVDTMTHPEYRRRGIYETLARKAYAEAASEGVYVGYRFPNKNSYPIAIKKLGWFDVTHLPLIFKSLNWSNTLKLRINNPLITKSLAISGNLLDSLFYRERHIVVQGLTITQVPYFDEHINEFWDRISSKYCIAIVRNKNYLNWRYVDIPDIDYSIYIAKKMEQVHGYLVLRCMQQGNAKIGIIFDTLAQSVEVAQCLISKAMEQCKYENVDLIYGGMRAGGTYLKALRKNGFMYIPSVVVARLCAYSSSPNISKEFLKKQQNWLVQIGDSDLK